MVPTAVGRPRVRLIKRIKPRGRRAPADQIDPWAVIGTHRTIVVPSGADEIPPGPFGFFRGRVPKQRLGLWVGHHDTPFVWGTLEGMQPGLLARVGELEAAVAYNPQGYAVLYGPGGDWELFPLSMRRHIIPSLLCAILGRIDWRAGFYVESAGGAITTFHTMGGHVIPTRVLIHPVSSTSVLYDTGRITAPELQEISAEELGLGHGDVNLWRLLLQTANYEATVAIEPAVLQPDWRLHRSEPSRGLGRRTMQDQQMMFKMCNWWDAQWGHSLMLPAAEGDDDGPRASDDNG